MKPIRIITPVKDALDLSLRAIEAVCASQLDIPFTYTVYDDFSRPENAARLDEEARRQGFSLVHLADLTTHPSPNYLLVLQREQALALAEGAALCIVESDVVVRPDTLRRICDVAASQPDVGLAGAVTTDPAGIINYPYVYAQGREGEVFATEEYISFCCTLLSYELLQRFDFGLLNPARQWHDAVISRRSLQLGLRNFLLADTPVIHFPHGSRPWRRLKETNRWRYYLLKFSGQLRKENIR
ncbi:MAG: glycosyltransferase family 2 protein [Tannerellaceae bacterium]|jgi:hypothetical protein|nr:glycosyltransferase family 2 protein [Tannerellaceae bacterium]